MSSCDASTAKIPVWNANNATVLHVDSGESSVDTYGETPQATCIKYARIIDQQNSLGLKQQTKLAMENCSNQRMRVYRSVMSTHKHDFHPQSTINNDSERLNQPRVSRYQVHYQIKSDRDTKVPENYNAKKVRLPVQPSKFGSHYERTKSLSPKRSSYLKQPSEEFLPTRDQTSKVHFSNVKAKVNTFIGKKPHQPNLQKEIKTQRLLMTEEKEKKPKRNPKTTQNIKQAINDALSKLSKSSGRKECTSRCNRVKRPPPTNLVNCFGQPVRGNTSRFNPMYNVPPILLEESKSTSSMSVSHSLPSLSVPSVDLVEWNMPATASQKSLFIREVITYKSSQKVNVDYDGLERPDEFESTAIATLGEPRLNDKKQPCNGENITTKVLDDIMNVDWSTPTSYHELFKPSKLFREISNKKVLESTIFSDQFQKELKFIVAFLESLHYLENNKISKYLEYSKNEAQKEFNNNLQSSSTAFTQQCNLLNSMANEESAISSFKCLHLLNLLLKDEQRRTRYLMHVFKKRENALFDQTKTQIIDYENKKKNNDTNLTSLKKKVRGALVKLQQECGEMERMKKALLSISDRRRTALLQTKRTIESKLKQSTNFDTKKPLRKISSQNTTKKNAPMKCFDLTNSSSCYEDDTLSVNTCKVFVNRSQETSETILKNLEAVNNVPPVIEARSDAAQATVTVSENASQISCKSGDSQVVNVDGDYMNIIFRSIGLPSVFCGGKEYEINESALKNLLDSSDRIRNGESLKNGFNLGNSVKNLIDSVNSVHSSPSTARSLVDELDEYFMDFKNDRNAASTPSPDQDQTDFEKLVVCLDKSLIQQPVTTERNSSEFELPLENGEVSYEDIKYLEKITSEIEKPEESILKEPSTVKVGDNVSNPLSIGSLEGRDSMKTCLDEYDYNFEYSSDGTFVDVESSKEMLTDTRDADKHKGVKKQPSLKWGSCSSHNDAELTNEIETDSDYADTVVGIKQFESAETIGDMPTVYTAQTVKDTKKDVVKPTSREEEASLSEAEALRRKQHQLELEIRALEEQQSQMFLVRPIPDKPPPPYTWPDKNHTSEFPLDIDGVLKYANLYTDFICKGISTRAEIHAKAKEMKLFTTPSFDDFLFDFVHEANEKHRTRQSQDPWDPNNVIPNKADREPIEVKIEKAIREVLGDVQRQDDNIETTKRLDDIDDILFTEWKEYETAWNSLEKDEIEVKNQLTNCIIYNLVDETISNYLKLKPV